MDNPACGDSQRLAKPVDTRTFDGMMRAWTYTVLALAVLTGGYGCAADEAIGARGLVAAATPEAADAGRAVLAAGGNAVDAAVAVSFALAVTEPAMSGLGGQSQIVMMGAGRPPLVINGTSFAPLELPDDVSRDALTGHRATTVPTTVRVLHHAWTKYGSGRIAWAELLDAAVRYAESGFVVGPYRHKVWRRHAADLRADSVVARTFLIDGDAPAQGARFRQPVLAATLRRLAADADEFYSGHIAEEIVRGMRAGGGWVTPEDLRSLPDPVELEPLHGTYRGVDVYSLPPPGGGWVVLQTLNLLERSSPDALAPGSATRPVLLADALRISHRHRREWPVTDLKDYRPETEARLAKDSAAVWWDRNRIGGETTHFSVVDGDGLAVSVTASINAYFGSRSTVASLGFLFNSYMHEFELDAPGHPFALQGGAMPYSSMSPTIVARDGRPVLVLGSPGSARIMSSVAQVTQAWIDGFGSIADVVARPRVHVVPDDRVYLETGDVVVGTGSFWHDRGLEVTQPSTDLMMGRLNAYYGGIHAIAFEDGVWRGAADPRRDGAVRYVRR